jgi:hypothetical protein
MYMAAIASDIFLHRIIFFNGAESLNLIILMVVHAYLF